MTFCKDIRLQGKTGSKFQACFTRAAEVIGLRYGLGSAVVHAANRISFGCPRGGDRQNRILFGKMNKINDLLRKGYTIKFSPDKDDTFQIMVSKPVDDDTINIKVKVSHYAVENTDVDIVDLVLREQEIKILCALENERR